MEDFKIKPIGSNEVGEQPGYDRSSLKGYKAEQQIKRIISSHSQEVIDVLIEAHNIPETIRISALSTKERTKMNRTLRSTENERYEYFTSIELLKDSVTSLPAKDCIRIIEEWEQNSSIPVLVKAIVDICPIVVS